MNQMAQAIEPASIRKEIRVATDIERAFDVFVSMMGQWWHKEHSIAHGTSQIDVIIEPEAGGRWYELGADGSEHQWGHVISYERPRRVLLGWQLNREFVFDPDLVTEVEAIFEEDGRGTLVRFEHRHLERMGENIAEMFEGMDGGWGMLLELYRACTEA